MKAIIVMLACLLLALPSNAQGYSQKEIECPCLLEYDFPKSWEEISIIALYGGIPVLRLDKAKVEGNKLLCIYDKEFAYPQTKIGTSMFYGIGVVIDGTNGDLSNIPKNLMLTLNEDKISDWHAFKKTAKLPHTYRGCVVYTLEACDWEDMFDWNGGFYSSEYVGNPVSLARTFTGHARVNQEGTGFILAKSKSGLYTPQAADPPNIQSTPKPLKRDK